MISNFLGYGVSQTMISNFLDFGISNNCIYNGLKISSIEVSPTKKIGGINCEKFSEKPFFCLIFDLSEKKKKKVCTF